jgi:hypothetical protein
MENLEQKFKKKKEKKQAEGKTYLIKGINPCSKIRHVCAIGRNNSTEKKSRK